MIAAYRHEDRQRGRELMEKLITDLSAGVPKVLTELTTVDRDKWRVELPQIEGHYETFGERLPGVLQDQLKDLEKRLAES